jgi:hypothetical protein
VLAQRGVLNDKWRWINVVSPLGPIMAREKRAILEELAAQAIRLGADRLEVEYKDRHEEVFAVKSGFGWGSCAVCDNRTAGREEQPAFSTQG